MRVLQCNENPTRVNMNWKYFENMLFWSLFSYSAILHNYNVAYHVYNPIFNDKYDMLLDIQFDCQFWMIFLVKSKFL